MQDWQWFLFGIGWSVGGVVFTVLYVRRQGEREPCHWTLADTLLLILASGPAVWALLLMTLWSDEP